MARHGRKPRGTAHVDRLSGSARAKLRLRVILRTLRGQWTIPQACEALGVGESRFHALRQQWLQEALELLEPRPVGRPTQAAAESQLQVEALETEVQQLRHQLHLATVREEVATVLGGAAAPGGVKKTGLKPR